MSWFYRQLSNENQSRYKKITLFGHKKMTILPPLMWHWVVGSQIIFIQETDLNNRRVVTLLLTHINFKQLCSKIQLPTTSRCNPAITRSVQYFASSNLRMLKFRNFPFFPVKYSDLKHSVLHFALCAKTNTFETRATIERFKVKGNSFYVQFYGNTLG